MYGIQSLQPLLAVVAPLVAVPGILSARTPNLREAWSFAASALLLVAVGSMVPGVAAGKTYYWLVANVLPGAPIAFRADALGMLLALVSSALWLVTSIYSIGYMRGNKEHAQSRFFGYFAVAIFCTVGVAFSANLLTMYLFYELLSFSTYPLVAHHQDEGSRKAGRKYLTFIVGTSIGLVLPSMIAIYQLTGNLDFATGGINLSTAQSSASTLLFLLLVFGFAKAALIPVHAWLPAAMVAPTPVSSLLHAVAVVKVGVFCILRVVTGVFGVETLLGLGLNHLLTCIAATTMILASLIALTQDGLKRRLAYSTIGQLSYIALGAGLMNEAGLTGGMLRMGGIGRRMPWTMAAFFIGSLSITGIPLTGGFVSKWFLLEGCVSSAQWWLAGALLFSSLLNAAYFFPIVYRAWFCPPGEGTYEGPVQEAPLACVAPLLVTAGISIVLFFYPDPFLNLARLAAQ